MINYILQIVLFQILFLAIYDLFLRKETFFYKNRWYLISTSVLSFLLPVVKIPTFKKAVPQEFVVYLPEIFLSPQKVIQKTSMYKVIDEVNYLHLLFIVGVVLFTFLFLIKIFKIFHLLKKHQLIKNDSYTLVLLPNNAKAFSFFNYIFLGQEILESQKQQIIAHELVHSQQKHSLDLVFFELLKIIMWFNPMIYLYQKRITLIHEYISDEIAMKSNSKDIYINNLLTNFFQVENIAFINQFYKQSLIKKRIIMMKKKQSKKMNQLKYLLLIPVLIAMLFYTACSDDVSSVDVISKKEIQTMFRVKDGNLVGEKGTKETYLDSYIGITTPLNTTEIEYKDLSSLERNEFELFGIKRKEILNNSSYTNHISFKFYKMPNGRNASAMVFDIEKMKNIISKNDDIIETEVEEVSFVVIDKAPTFPGCDSGDKKCFSKMVQKHFSRNFDSNLPNKLGLETGKKRIFIGFKIDKNGSVVDINARAPHIKLKEEVLRVMNTLPKMTPGEHKGEKMIVKYAIPFTIIVE